MDKFFAVGISGMFATVTAGVLGVPALFAQADAPLEALGLLGHGERLGICVALLFIGYKIIVKLIDVFEKSLMVRLKAHDEEVQGRLSDIRKTLETHVSGVSKKEEQ